MPRELGRADHGRVGQRVAGPVSRWTGSSNTRTAAMSPESRAGSTARNDASTDPDVIGFEGRVGVEERHDVEFDLGARAMEPAQHGRRSEPPSDQPSTRSAA